MKLERINIEHFGAWQNLDLPVDPDGISVYFGPNEAGKTTLMRFIRSVLYGFPKPDKTRSITDDTSSQGGFLQVQHQQESWLVHRAGQPGSRGLVTARLAESTGEVRTRDGSALVSDLVDGVSESVYENIFAIGLYELQELATLDGAEVARQIYSLSLGLDGRRLIALMDEVRERRDELLDAVRGTGRLAELYDDIAQLDSQLEQRAGTRRRHTQLTEQQERSEEHIVGLKSRQQGLEEQLRGHEYMDRVHEPWLKVRKLETELKKLPDVPDFPQNGLAELQQAEAELAAIRGRSGALREEARQMREQAAKLDTNPSFRRFAPAIQGYVDQRGWIADLSTFAMEGTRRIEELKGQLQGRLKELGSEWNVERLKRVDVSHLAGHCLSERAEAYRTLSRRRRQVVKQYKALSKKFHRRQERVQEVRRQLGGQTLAQAIDRTRAELTQLEDLSRLRVREAELTQRRIGIANQLQRITLDPSLPQWVYGCFAALGMAGLVLGVVGIVTGLTPNGVSGIGYAMLGLCCAGMTWALKEHFEGEIEKTRLRLQDELRELDHRLTETSEAIRKVAPLISSHSAIDSAGRESRPVDQAAVLTELMAQARLQAAEESGSLPPPLPAFGPAPQAAQEQKTHRPVRQVVRLKSRAQSEGDMLRECLERLRHLEFMARVSEWIERTRPQLISMRQRLRDTQRDFGVARRNWCSQLVEQGLAETIEIESALSQRDLVARTAMLVQRIEDLAADTHVARRMCERFRKRVEELGHRLQLPQLDYTQPVKVLDQWAEDLVRLSEVRKEQRKLIREAKLKRIEATKYRSRIRRLETRRDALLVRGGAIDRKDFEARASVLEKRFELQEKLDRARHELSRVAATERAIAVVESDLEAYNPKQNQQAIATLRKELEDVSLDLEEAFEQLGRVKSEIDTLENDQTAAALRLDREDTLSRITDLAEEWFALDWCVQTLDELRMDYERNHQPPILNRAKEYLQRMSGGRYTNIWTPLGQRTLCVDDRDSNTLMVENLSGGTREQLFLAIRLALIEHFASKGVELPVVLDDILVNFDEERTRATVEELIRLTGHNQQILFFTCHQYLAEMFRQRGVSTVMLPDRRALQQERRAG